MQVLLVLLFFSISIFLCSSSLAQDNNFKKFKFVFLPDIHLSFEKKDDWIMRNESLVILQDVIKSINKIDDLNFLVWGGNLVDNKDKQLLDLSIFLDAISELNSPYYVILGDRDVDLLPDYTKQHFCSEFRRNGFLDTNKTYWNYEPSENLLFIGLDTTIKNKSTGEISPEQLLWLDNILKNNPNKFTIITMHHPAYIESLPPNPEYRSASLIANAQEFLNIINQYPQVKLILSGHIHAYSASKLNSKLFINIPSIVTYPNEFKIITVSQDKIQIESMPISFKQIVKKSKKALINSDYALNYGFKNKKEILNFHSGSKFSKTKAFYLNK